MAGFIEFIRFSKNHYAGQSTSFGKQQADAQPMIEHLAPFAMHFLYRKTLNSHELGISTHLRLRMRNRSIHFRQKNHLVNLNFYNNKMEAIFDKLISKIGEKTLALFLIYINNLYFARAQPEKGKRRKR